MSFEYIHPKPSSLNRDQFREIAIGDKVIVTFVDGDLGKPLVLDKVV